ncbi:GNAT family N-acetyltransferase [Candidatus Berkiella aquae]|uniref:GNAT family N-acetyltransferase n=1 Tax=Candidatus Berkiella aquae TaxID=295108 RepID=A0A0Q9YUY5_9GAMM|nr:GNAT family N-acetyltransferase [Candidatus Berkiella aquae]MCS5710858.1 GNAT family N-acetyltransferase [Candidatus Berkiella aquae]
MQYGPIPLKVIKTDRLIIRPVRISDAAAMHGAMKASFQTLKQWMPWAQSLASLRDTEVYLAHGEKIWSSPAHEGIEQPLQIMDVNDKIYYGATGIKPANLMIPSFEIGYWANQPYAGKGIITEAMNALSRYLFDVLKAKRIEINCEEKNIRSAQVAIRLGYQEEGKLHNHRLNASGKMLSNSLIFGCTDIAKLPPLTYQYEK